MCVSFRFYRATERTLRVWFTGDTSLCRRNFTVNAAPYWLGCRLCGIVDRAEVSLSALGDLARCKTYMFINSYLE